MKDSLQFSSTVDIYQRSLYTTMHQALKKYGQEVFSRSLCFVMETRQTDKIDVWWPRDEWRPLVTQGPAAALSTAQWGVPKPPRLSRNLYYCSKTKLAHEITTLLQLNNNIFASQHLGGREEIRNDRLISKDIYLNSTWKGEGQTENWEAQREGRFNFTDNGMQKRCKYAQMRRQTVLKSGRTVTKWNIMIRYVSPFIQKQKKERIPDQCA